MKPLERERGGERTGRRSVKPATNKQTAGLVVAALLVVFLIGWAGYGINSATHPDKTVTVTSTFTGKVTIVSDDRSSGCVQPDGGGAKVCSNFAILPGAAVQTGHIVQAAHEKVNTGRGNSYDLLLIYPEDSR